MKPLTGEEMAAISCYLRRQERTEHPQGHSDSRSTSHRWYPSDEERQACCTVRAPSRAYPWSLMVHCRSLLHIAHLYGVEEGKLRSALAIADHAGPPTE